MPIYSYRCDQCGHQKDVLQKMSDPLLVTCPACGQASFRKQVTAAGFQLKGSGWYVTDFRNPPAKEASKGVAKSDSETGGAKESVKPSETTSTTDSAAKPASVSESAPASASAKPATSGSGGTS